jgi:TAZ zinc finger
MILLTLRSRLRHKNAKQRNVCKSTKFMMLHVRDCPGTTASFDVCPFPWCRKVKHLLYHLVSCSQPTICAICSPTSLSPEMRNLARLNKHRLKCQRERLLASYKAGAAACQPTEGHDPLEARPSTVTSSKKPTATQRGMAHSKPKAAASRAKARGAVQPAERPAKAGKPAANAAQMQALDLTKVTTGVQCDPPAPTTKSDVSEPQPSKLVSSPTSAPAVVKLVGTASSTAVSSSVQETIAPSGDNTNVDTNHNHAPDTLPPTDPAHLQSQSHASVAGSTTATPGSADSSAQAKLPALTYPTNPPIPMAAAQALEAAEYGLQHSDPSAVCFASTASASCTAGEADTKQLAMPLTKASTSVPVDKVVSIALGAAGGAVTKSQAPSVTCAATVPVPAVAGAATKLQPAMPDQMRVSASVPVDSV